MSTKFIIDSSLTLKYCVHVHNTFSFLLHLISLSVVTIKTAQAFYLMDLYSVSLTQKLLTNFLIQFKPYHELALKRIWLPIKKKVIIYNQFIQGSHMQASTAYFYMKDSFWNRGTRKHSSMPWAAHRGLRFFMASYCNQEIMIRSSPMDHANKLQGLFKDFSKTKNSFQGLSFIHKSKLLDSFS